VSDHTPPDLLARLTAAIHAAGWHPTPLRAWLPPGSSLLGAWRSPDHGAYLAAGEPESDFYGPESFAGIALCGAQTSARPWAVTGQCPPDLLPTLLAAACLPPGTPAPDPISLLPDRDFFRETSYGYPRGQYVSDRWIQWDFPGPYHRLGEVEWLVPGSARPDVVGGWYLAHHGSGGAQLHADLATPRHLITALVTAMTLHDDPGA
jgi:hypothetical protein